MASKYDDPTTWRLKTKGGISYRVVSWTGTADMSSRTVVGVFLVPAASLKKFIDEMVPPPVFVLGIPTYYNAELPNNPELRATSVSWRAHNDSKPVDAYGTDTTSTSIRGTYGTVVEATVTFDNSIKEAMPNDPWTFLDISCTVSGEFYHLEPDGNWDSATGTKSKTSPNVTQVVPEIEWTVRYPLVSKGHFEQILKPKLDMALGKVNSEVFNALLYSPANCVLFLGYELEEENSVFFADGLNDIPLNISMKFLEKKVAIGSTEAEGFYGHQHIWNKETGRWQELYVNGLPLYRTFNMNILFDGLPLEN